MAAISGSRARVSDLIEELGPLGGVLLVSHDAGTVQFVELGEALADGALRGFTDAVARTPAALGHGMPSPSVA